MKQGDSAAGKARGVVAFDVDGVLLRRFFLSTLAWTAGPTFWLRSLWLGFLLKIGLIDLSRAVEEAYRLERGRPMADIVALAEELSLARGARDVVAELRRAGYAVALVSAGVPQEVVERIAARIGADASHGVLLEEDDGVFTGRLLGARESPRGKREGLEAILSALGFGWADTTVIVDDASNSEIVEAAWRSIAVNPEYPILKKASFVLHTRDLSEILEFFPEGYEVGITPQWLAVRHEVFRKAIHVCAVFVPLIAVWSKPLTLWLVGSVTMLFVLSELCRLSGLALPLFANVTWRAMRATESRGIVAGPILFGIGIWFSVALFSRSAATAGILILAIGDSVAGLLGRAFGDTLLPHNPGKTLLGSLSLFAVGAIIAMFYVSLPWALAVGAVASFVESLPLGPSDNVLLPLATAWSVALARAMGG